MSLDTLCFSRIWVLFIVGLIVSVIFKNLKLNWLRDIVYFRPENDNFYDF
jgi:hypothetical protein